MNDSTNAESCVNKASHLMHKLSEREKELPSDKKLSQKEKDSLLLTCKDLQMRYKRAHIRVLDSKREFILSAQGYYNLSFSEGIDREEVQDILRLAITTTLLAPTGPRKYRLLTVLYNDVRSKSVPFYELL